MTFHYNVTGQERKKLATTLGEILRQPVIYSRAPAFAYAVGGCLIDRNGCLICPPGITIENARYIAENLKKRGFTADDSDYEQIADIPEPEDNNRLVLELPRSDFNDVALENLKKIVASKESLIKKALGADRLVIFSDEQSLRFPWFTITGADGEADAYSRFVSALCDMAKRQKRVYAKEHDSNNDKFTFRLFLIRLGFVGAEFKQARKILLRNLTGNSSWKNGQRPESNEGG